MRFASPAGADVTQRLLDSAEPSIRLQVLTDLLGQPGDSREVRRLRDEVRTSSRVATLLSQREETGRIPHHPYRAKWYGAHWVLVALADLGYPTGDESLLPLLDQILGWLFSSDYQRYLARVHRLPTLHASIDGNAVWSTLSLGIADERTERLVKRLLDTQWPDGGWNCDRRASGRSSSSPKVSYRCVLWPCMPGWPETNGATLPPNAPAGSSWLADCSAAVMAAG